MALCLRRLSFVAFALSLRLRGFGLKASCKNPLWLWNLLIWKWITSSNLESRMHLSTELYAFGLCVFIVLLYLLLGLLFCLCLYYLFFCFPRVDWKANSRFSLAFWTLQDRPTLSLTLLQSFAMLRVFSSFLSAFSAGFSACKLTKKHWVSESLEWSKWRNHNDMDSIWSMPNWTNSLTLAGGSFFFTSSSYQSCWKFWFCNYTTTDVCAKIVSRSPSFSLPCSLPSHPWQRFLL